MKISGLALATSISGINTCLILFFILRKKLKDLVIKPFLYSFIRILLASLAMGVVCDFASSKYIIFLNTTITKLLSLGFTVITGLLAYAMFCFLFGVREIQELWQWLVHRKGLSPKGTVPEI
jgi:putative peptidoglycan lipid II flippase